MLSVAEMAQLEEISNGLAATNATIETISSSVRELQGTVSEIRVQLTQQAPPPTAVRAPLPESFKGHGEDFPYFMQNMRSYCELTNVPASKRVTFAVRCLQKGPAKVWAAYSARAVTFNTGEDLTDLDVFSKALSHVYDTGDRATKARLKLDKIFQGADSLERYVAEIEAEEEISAPEMLMKFKSGLKSSLLLVALFDTQMGKPFTSVEALIEFLTRYDAALSGVQTVNGLRAAPSDARPHKRLRGPPCTGSRSPSSGPGLQEFQPASCPRCFCAERGRTGAGPGLVPPVRWPSSGDAL